MLYDQVPPICAARPDAIESTTANEEVYLAGASACPAVYRPPSARSEKDAGGRKRGALARIVLPSPLVPQPIPPPFSVLVGLHLKWRDVAPFGYILRGAIRSLAITQSEA